MHAGGTSLLDTGMALNQAQLLVHANEALDRFHTDHRILNDVVIERLGPNDDADWGCPVLPPLQVRGQAPRPRGSLSDEVNDLFEGTSAELRRLLEEAKSESSDSNESSSSSWNVDLGDKGLDEEAEVEDGEEVDQLREVIKHFYTHSDSSSSSSRRNEETMAPKVRILGKGQAPRIEPTRFLELLDSSILVLGKGAGSAIGTLKLWTPQFTAIELGKHVTSADTSKDHETCIALGNAMMLPQDVADHVVETTVEFGGKLVMLGAQVSTLVLWVPHLDFNEEEYATLPTDGGNVNIAVAEARADIEGTVDGDRADQVEGDRDGEAEGTVVCSQQMSLSSSLLGLPTLEDLCRFWGIKMLVVCKIFRNFYSQKLCSIKFQTGVTARAGGLVELASPSPLAFAEYRSLVGTLPYLKATIHKAAALLAVLDDQSVVSLLFRIED
ncbi:hypothetical protein Acr_00g0045630 [Actinidia rufa]|uniref:Uncharacterized protein n=1 Tax=Actinidia rufa TaxID=165716 RepID=A0A7J0DL27_9ERIC|nr:hypothetical protein Acr_00g0045630 [Actinidia rufa]